MTPNELKKTIENIKKTEISLGSPIKTCTESEIPNRDKLKKSLYISQNIKKGETFSLKNLSAKRPAVGISPSNYKDILGKKAKSDLKIDDLLKKENYE